MSLKAAPFSVYATRDAQRPVVGVRVQFIIPGLGETPGQVERGGPLLGEHNQQVYGELLGLRACEMAELRERGII